MQTLLVVLCVMSAIELVLLAFAVVVVVRIAIYPKGSATMSTPLEDSVAALEAEVASHTSVDASATALINGITDRIKKAVDDALAGAAPTPDAAKLAARINAVLDSMKASGTPLSAAVVANTPAAPATLPVAETAAPPVG